MKPKKRSQKILQGFNIQAIAKHGAKVCIVGASIISIVIVNMRIVSANQRLVETLEFLLFLFLVGCAGFLFRTYRRYNQPWLFIIATSAAVFNYFFSFVLRSKPGVYATVIGLVIALIWNIVIDVAKPDHQNDLPKDPIHDLDEEV